MEIELLFWVIEDEDIPVNLNAVRTAANDSSSKRKRAAGVAAAISGGAGLSTMFKKETLKRVDSFEEEVQYIHTALSFSVLFIHYIYCIGIGMLATLAG